MSSQRMECHFHDAAGCRVVTFDALVKILHPDVVVRSFPLSSVAEDIA